jgi:hypothetical protein
VGIWTFDMQIVCREAKVDMDWLRRERLPRLASNSSRSSVGSLMAFDLHSIPYT